MPNLLFFLSCEFNEDDVMRVFMFVNGMSKRRGWPLGAPRFIDDTDDRPETMTSPDDVPVRTVGGELSLPTESLEGISLLVENLGMFTSKTGLSFEFELDSRYAGTLANGEPDEMLAALLKRQVPPPSHGTGGSARS